MRQLQKYDSLLYKMLYSIRGSHSTNTYIELQVLSIGNGYFRVYFTDGFKYLNSGKVYRLNDLKKAIRAFINLE